MRALLTALCLCLLPAAAAAAPCPAGHSDVDDAVSSDTVTKPWSSVRPAKPRGFPHCRRCEKGAVTVRASDGRVHCVGGRVRGGDCRGGGSVAVHLWGQPYKCLPCPE